VPGSGLRVPVPAAARVGDLPGRCGLVEAEGTGDDRCGPSSTSWRSALMRASRSGSPRLLTCSRSVGA
jgi:hypothetical protein